MITTLSPPLVQPSLGETALIQGVAIGSGGYMPVKKQEYLIYECFPSNLLDFK